MCMWDRVSTLSAGADPLRASGAAESGGWRMTGEVTARRDSLRRCDVVPNECPKAWQASTTWIASPKKKEKGGDGCVGDDMDYINYVCVQREEEMHTREASAEMSRWRASKMILIVLRSANTPGQYATIDEHRIAVCASKLVNKAHAVTHACVQESRAASYLCEVQLAPACMRACMRAQYVC